MKSGDWTPRLLAWARAHAAHPKHPLIPIARQRGSKKVLNRFFGQQLVQQALVDARAQGFAAVELWCIPSNAAARGLYEACGFRAGGAVRTTSHLTGHPLQEVAYRVAL